MLVKTTNSAADWLPSHINQWLKNFVIADVYTIQSCLISIKVAERRFGSRRASGT